MNCNLVFLPIILQMENSGRHSIYSLRSSHENMSLLLRDVSLNDLFFIASIQISYPKINFCLVYRSAQIDVEPVLSMT